MNKVQISTHAKVVKDGEIRWEETGKTVEPIVEETGSDNLSDFSKTKTSAAEACIYCGSTEGRTREHVIAYALGGTVTIPMGSCRSCQKITHKFETAVLRGPMQMVRYIQRLPSRTKHKDVPQTVPLLVTVKGKEQEIEVPIGEAPILLAFPTFEEPTYLAGIDSPIKLNGVTTGSYGADPEEFARRIGASKIRFTSSGNAPVAFAQMVAKTAYANAYVNGQIDRLKNPEQLVEAMLHNPETIGRFVGTLPQPYIRRNGVIHYLGIHELLDPHVLYSKVQFFAGSGAPTYVVILGDLK
jgi:hypothetical protein